LSPLSPDSSNFASISVRKPPTSRRQRAPATLQKPRRDEKNLSDREHLRGVPVSKIMEGAGHRSMNQCPSPAHSDAVLDSRRRLFSRWASVSNRKPGFVPAQIWQMPSLLLLR